VWTIQLKPPGEVAVASVLKVVAVAE